MANYGDGSLIRLDGVAPSQMAGMSASVIFPCTIEVQKILLAPSHLGITAKMAIKRLCVCTCVCKAVHRLQFTICSL